MLKFGSLVPVEPFGQVERLNDAEGPPILIFPLLVHFLGNVLPCL